MKKSLFMSVAAAAVFMLAGCAEDTLLLDPSRDKTGIRDNNTVSAEEMREVAVAAVNNLLNSYVFKSFLERYRAEAGKGDPRPILKLDRCINSTSDPDLNTDLITDLLNTELLNSGRVRITMAEGQGRSKAIAQSRALEDDDNFNQSTVAKRGTLLAARLILRPKVDSNVTHSGRKRVEVRTFVLEMADIHTGMVEWKFVKQLGFMKKKAVVGW